MTEVHDRGTHGAPRSLVLIVLIGAFPSTGQASPIKHSSSQGSGNLSHQVDTWWGSVVKGAQHWFSAVAQGASSLVNLPRSAGIPVTTNPSLLAEWQRLRDHNPAQFDARHPRLAALLDQSSMQGSVQAQTLQPSTVAQVASSAATPASGSASRIPVVKAECLTARVPEPSSWALACALIGAAAWWGRPDGRRVWYTTMG
jgi:hypothetical protein